MLNVIRMETIRQSLKSLTDSLTIQSLTDPVTISLADSFVVERLQKSVNGIERFRMDSLTNSLDSVSDFDIRCDRIHRNSIESISNSVHSIRSNLSNPSNLSNLSNLSIYLSVDLLIRRLITWS